MAVGTGGVNEKGRCREGPPAALTASTPLISSRQGRTRWVDSPFGGDYDPYAHVRVCLVDIPINTLTHLKVGELARRTGKTVRAIHLYEELGLLFPIRSKGGFRLYAQRAVERVQWIQKLQDMGFSLPDIKAFLQVVWEQSETAPDAMSRVREIFSGKLAETRETIQRMEGLARELEESLAYLDTCKTCEPVRLQSECDCCDVTGHEGPAPLLVDGITRQ